MSWLLLLLLALPGRAEEPKAVCATRPLEALPAGVAFVPTEKFKAKARAQVAKETDTMRRSPYETETFYAIFDTKVTWADGSQVSVSCSLSATLHQIENGRFTVKSARQESKTSPYPAAGQPPHWLRVVYDLADGEIDFPASLTCEIASARQDAAHPYASIDKQHIEIGTLQNLLSDTLRMGMRTETEPKACAGL